MKHVLWFKEIDDKDLNTVGGKGANLGVMKDQFPIPPGYCISAQSYFQIIEDLEVKEKIKGILDNLDVNDTDDLQNKAEKIKNIFLKLKIPDDIIQIYFDAFDELANGKEIHTAIRSSATAEDLPEASFAGQQDTYLGVDRENYIEAIKKCWASLFTPRAIYYREENGFDHLNVGISVIVQVLVEAEVAGVMFTKNPSTGDNIVIIEAGFGLGDTVVGGEITPDTYKVDPDEWKIKSKEISDQSYKMIRDGNKTQTIPLEDGDKQKLSDKQIIELAKIGMNIEELYNGQPQDIEWAVDEEIYIVQSRPITTIENNQKSPTNDELKILVSGLAASPGIGTGEARIILDSDKLGNFEEGQVLVTAMTSPDWVPAMRKSAAIITDEGGTTSHAAIVSRELGVPAIVGTSNATKVLDENQTISVDGDEGNVYQGKIEKDKSTTKENETQKKPVRPSIVTATKLYVNISSPKGAKKVANQDVDGVGLLRAEFIAAQLGKHPKKAIDDGEGENWSNKLANNIEAVVGPFHPRPVVYRTLDFKTNEYRDLPGGENYEPHENNPMLGYRGAFRNLHDNEVFSLELEAIKKVRDKGYDNLFVMIPFVRTVNELKQVIEIMDDYDLERSTDFKLWIMVEVPSTVFLIEEFLKYVDGISIGTNDLTQLILGVDRDNEHLSEIFDERDPAVLAALKHVITACKDHNKTSSVCGQAPTKYEEIVQFLVENGVTSMSVSPDALMDTRKTIARIEKKQLLDKTR